MPVALWPDDVVVALAADPTLLAEMITRTEEALAPAGAERALALVEMFRQHFGGTPLPDDEDLRKVGLRGRQMDEALIGEIPASLLVTATERLWARWQYAWRRAPTAADFREAIEPEWSALKIRLEGYRKARANISTVAEKALEEARDRAEWIKRRRAYLARVEAEAQSLNSNPGE
jgi:hypothetical protein